MKRWLAAALGLTLALGCADFRWLHSRGEAARSRQLLLGASVYHDRCSPCHGDRGLGDGVLADVLPKRPRNYHAEPFKWGSTPAAIAVTVRQGRSGVMPPFAEALDESEIVAVSELVASWAAAAEKARAEQGRSSGAGAFSSGASRTN